MSVVDRVGQVWWNSYFDPSEDCYVDEMCLCIETNDRGHCFASLTNAEIRSGLLEEELLKGEAQGLCLRVS